MKTSGTAGLRQSPNDHLCLLVRQTICTRAYSYKAVFPKQRKIAFSGPTFLFGGGKTKQTCIQTKMLSLFTARYKDALASAEDRKLRWTPRTNCRSLPAVMRSSSVIRNRPSKGKPDRTDTNVTNSSQQSISQKSSFFSTRRCFETFVIYRPCEANHVRKERNLQFFGGALKNESSSSKPSQKWYWKDFFSLRLTASSAFVGRPGWFWLGSVPRNQQHMAPRVRTKTEHIPITSTE